MPSLNLTHGKAHLDRGDYAKAKVFFRNLLKSDPVHVEALNYLAMAELLLGENDAALANMRKALLLQPSNPRSFNNFGVAQLDLGLCHFAKEAFRRAVELDPRYADAWSNLGAAMLRLGEDPDDIEIPLATAFSLKPEHYDNLGHLAELRLRQNRHRERAALLDRRAVLRPSGAAGDWRKAAQSLIAAGDHTAAARYTAKAAEADTDDAELLKFHGECLGESGEVAAAKSILRRAATRPGGQPIWRWKHLAYCPVFFPDVDAIDAYWTALREDLRAALSEASVYDWRTLSRDGFAPSFQLTHHNRCCREVREQFAALFAPSFDSFPRRENPTRPKGKRIRVGFVAAPGHEAGFLRAHRMLVERLDPARFEAVLLYRADAAPLFAGLHGGHIAHAPFPGQFHAAAERIGDTQCDILYHWKAAEDVWTMFLPMCRPAPLQCTAWGTHGSSGVPHMDYYLSWDAAETLGAEERYSEKLVRFSEPPGLEPPAGPVPAADRRALGLPGTGAVYFCPHRVQKYHPEFDEYLRRILAGDPDGCVVMLMAGEPGTVRAFRQRIRARVGDAAFWRVVFLPALSPEVYYRYLSAATVVLESPCYAGEFTGADAIRHAVPGVTLEGELLVQRYSAARYRRMGLEELIAGNREEYVAAALRLGTDVAHRREMASRLVDNRGAVLNRLGVVGEFERFLERAMDTHRLGTSDI